MRATGSKQLRLRFDPPKETRFERLERILGGQLGRTMRPASELMFDYDKATARARGMYDEAAKERQKRKPADSVVENLPPQKARDAAGKALGVSGKSVDFASRVLKQGTPEAGKDQTCYA